MKGLFILLFCGFLLAQAEVWTIELKDRAEDYGAGPKNMMLHYSPRGIPPNVGCFVGHANLLSRDDRALMRFDLGELYLMERLPEIRTAWLEFSISSTAGEVSAHKLIIEHLDYQRNALTKEDLVQPEATIVAEVPMKQGTVRLEVTDCIKRDLAGRCLFAPFRFSSTCGMAPNATANPIGCHVKTPFDCAEDLPVLVLEWP